MSCAFIIGFGEALRRARRRLSDSLAKAAAAGAADARLAAVMRDAHDAIVALTPDGRIDAWNPAAERLFGYSAEEAIGQHGDFMTPPEALAERRDWMQRVQRGETVSAEGVRITRSGGRVEVRFNLAPMQSAGGVLTGVSAIVQDITARKEAERALHQHEQMLRAFYDNAPVFMGVVELTDDGDILHLHDNALACRLYGVAPGASANRRSADLGATPEARSRWLAHYRRSAESGQPVSFTFRSDRYAERWFSATVAPIGASPSGRPRLCYVAQDITERKRTEEVLRLADRRKDEFLATLAHELRNPLAPIRNARADPARHRRRPAGGRRAAGHDGAAGRADGAAGRRPARRVAHQPRQDRAAPRAGRPGERDAPRGRDQPAADRGAPAIVSTSRCPTRR